MIIYEVNIRVERIDVREYSEWLRLHVDDMLRLPGFLGAKIFARKPEDEGQVSDSASYFTVHYELKDQGSLDRYLREFAPKMRALAQEKFGEHFKVQRRVLRLIRSD
jgi:hypothetical protein